MKFKKNLDLLSQEVVDYQFMLCLTLSWTYWLNGVSPVFISTYKYRYQQIAHS